MKRIHLACGHSFTATGHMTLIPQNRLGQTFSQKEKCDTCKKVSKVIKVTNE